MAIANELSGDVAIAVLARAGSEVERDKTKLKEILVNFYSALHSLRAFSRRKHVKAKTAGASLSHDSTSTNGH